MYARLILEASGVTLSGEFARLRLEGDFFELSDDLAGAADDATNLVEAARFLMAGGSGHPEHPWTEDQSEPGPEAA